MHLADFCGYPWAATIPRLTVSALKNAIGSINRYVSFIDGFHGKKGDESLERNPFRGMPTPKGIPSGPHGDS